MTVRSGWHGIGRCVTGTFGVGNNHLYGPDSLVYTYAQQPPNRLNQSPRHLVPLAGIYNLVSFTGSAAVVVSTAGTILQATVLIGGAAVRVAAAGTFTSYTPTLVRAEQPPVVFAEVTDTDFAQPAPLEALVTGPSSQPPPVALSILATSQPPALAAEVYAIVLV